MRRRLGRAVGTDEEMVASAQQVHGNKIAVADHPGHYPHADGLMTDVPGLLISVVVADCYPIYVWSENIPCVAIFHAGWRGTAAHITARGIQLFMDRYGIRADDISALIGPGICASCYEVGEEVAKKFSHSVLAPSRPGYYLLNLSQTNKTQLESAGVPSRNIAIDNRCTYCHPDLFFSYRREGKDTGRNFAAIGILPSSSIKSDKK
ncbi:MAG: peptidoglycan editing factor PgeF [bacterium]|nr:peptidoglycan editing factor PgeF [bacterium]